MSCIMIFVSGGLSVWHIILVLLKQDFAAEDGHD